MTADVVIAGKGGFIGGILSSTLADRGIDSVEVRDFAAGSGTAKLLVNLANIPEDPAADLELLDERIALVGDRAGHWLQVQSFITLHGRGELDTSAFNAGFKPVALDRYGIGKLTEERRLCSAAAAGEVGPLTLAYLPAVLDEGGPWSRARAQAKRNGYLLPLGMSRAARANFTYVSDLADLVVAWLGRDDSQPVTRVIVNDPLSRTTTWPEFLGSNQLSLRHDGAPAAFKRTARYAKGRLSAWRYARAAADRLGPPAGQESVAESAEPVESADPLEFTSALRYLVQHQAFLPPTPYR